MQTLTLFFENRRFPQDRPHVKRPHVKMFWNISLIFHYLSYETFNNLARAARKCFEYIIDFS